MKDYDRMTRAYIKMREARAELKRDYEARDGQIKEQMSAIEASLLADMNESGAESIRTNNGTVYTTDTAKASVADWSALGDWIIEHNALDLLEQRIRAGEVSKYLVEFGELPPGVNLHRERVVRVRKS